MCLVTLDERLELWHAASWTGAHGTRCPAECICASEVLAASARAVPLDLSPELKQSSYRL